MRIDIRYAAAAALGLAAGFGAAQPAQATPIGAAYVTAAGTASGAANVYSEAFVPFGGAGRTYDLLFATSIQFSAGFDLPYATPATYAYSVEATLDGDTVISESGSLGAFSLSTFISEPDFLGAMAEIEAIVTGGPYAGYHDGGSFEAAFTASFTPLSATSVSGTFTGLFGVVDEGAFPQDAAALLGSLGLPGQQLVAFGVDLFESHVRPHLPFGVDFTLDASVTASVDQPGSSIDGPSAVPVPAAAPLLMGALGLMGLVARPRPAA